LRKDVRAAAAAGALTRRSRARFHSPAVVLSFDTRLAVKSRMPSVAAPGHCAGAPECGGRLHRRYRRLRRSAAICALCRSAGQSPSRPAGFRAIPLYGRLAMYQSDITQFLNQLKQQKPSLEQEQRQGRALLWDKQPINLEERAEQNASRVEQTPYVYYQNF
jgi:hypothetical protein